MFFPADVVHMPMSGLRRLHFRGDTSFSTGGLGKGTHDATTKFSSSPFSRSHPARARYPHLRSSTPRRNTYERFVRAHTREMKINFTFLTTHLRIYKRW